MALEQGPLFCDHAEAMRHVVEAYDAGWNVLRGHTTVSIDSMREWADAMERASLIIEGPAE